MRNGARSDSSYSPNLPPSAAPRLAATDRQHPYNRYSSMSTKPRHDLIRQRPSSSSGDSGTSRMSDNSDYKSRSAFSGDSSHSSISGGASRMSNGSRPSYQFDGRNLNRLGNGNNNKSIQSKELGHGIQLSERQMQLRQYHSRKIGGMSPRVNSDVSKEKESHSDKANRVALSHVDTNSPNPDVKTFKSSNADTTNKENSSSSISQPKNPLSNPTSAANLTSSHRPGVNASQSYSTGPPKSSHSSSMSSPTSPKRSKSLVKRMFKKVRSSKHIGTSLSSPKSSASSASSSASTLSSPSSTLTPMESLAETSTDSTSLLVETNKRKQPVANEKINRKINDARESVESRQPTEAIQRHREAQMASTTSVESSKEESGSGLLQKQTRAKTTEKARYNLPPRKTEALKVGASTSDITKQSRSVQSAGNVGRSGVVSLNTNAIGLGKGEQNSNWERNERDKSSNQEIWNDKSDIIDTEFQSFVDELKREVSCDHTELWDNFQKSLGHTDDTVEPLHPIEISSDGKKKKKHRLNVKAQKTLSSIHEHLMGQSRRSDCTSSSQLVNDKSIARERIKRGEYNRNSLSGKGGNKGMFSAKGSRVEEQRLPQTRPSDKKEKRHILSPSTKSRNEASIDAQLDADVGSKSHHEILSEPKKSVSFNAVSETSTAATSGETKGVESYRKSDAEPSQNAPKQKSWLIALKEKQRKLREEQEGNGDPVTKDDGVKGNVEEEGMDAIASIFGKRIASTIKKKSPEQVQESPQKSSPWPVKLKSVAKTPHVDVSKQDAAHVMASNNSQNPSVTPAAWAKPPVASTTTQNSATTSTPTISTGERNSQNNPKQEARIKLKPTPTHNRKESDSGETLSAAELFRARAALHHAEPNPTPTHNRKESDSGETLSITELFRDRAALHHAEQTPTKSTSKISCENESFVGVIIDADDLPKDMFATQDEASLFWIGRDDDKQEKYLLAVGRRFILTARHKPPDAVGNKVEITWCSRREDIKSLTLDVEATVADLALSDGSSKPFLFASADECLCFAQDFYRHKTTSTTRSRPPRPNQPQKQVIVNVEEKQVPATSIEIDEEDEKELKKYRLMLKMQTPPEAVRHKMTLEQVDQRLIDKLFSENLPFDEKRDESASVLDAIVAKQNFSSLTEEEESVASKYRKMLKMSVPPDAVRHKMTQDRIDTRIVHAVLDEEGANARNSNEADNKEKSHTKDLTKEEEELASKYCKMLKMSVPPDAVRHKMTQDKIATKIVNAVLGIEEDNCSDSYIDASEESFSVIDLTKEEEELASKYRKMLKMSVPSDAVRHKMTRDNIDTKIIDTVLGPDPSASSTKKPILLSEEEEKLASTYRKMLKMNIPKEAVEHKMKRDQVDESIVLAVLGQEGVGTSTLAGPKRKNSSGTIKRRKTTGERSLVALHWTPLAGGSLERSVWGKAVKKRRRTVLEPQDGDISKLEELFQKKSTARLAGGGKLQKIGAIAEESNDEKQMAKLMDLTRANNVAISLKAFKDFTHEELSRTLGDLDPERKIKGERVQFISNLLPTPVEAKAIQSYKGDESRLVPAEIFFRHLESVQRVEAKVHVMQTMETFHHDAEEARKNFLTLGKTCRQIIDSEKLLQVLETVLTIGNIMNEGTRNGEAEGFKFDSLLKLTQTKGVDGKTTVLDYIVSTFDAKNELASLDLMSEFPECQTASRMMLSEMISDLRTMRMNLNKCKTELIKMKNEQSDKRVTRSMTSKFQESADKSSNDPRSALMAAIQGIQSDKEEEDKEEPANARNALLNAIEKHRPGSGEINKSSSTSKEEKGTSFSPGVHRLEEFMKGANSTLSKLEKDRDNAIQTCKDLACYCGEDGEERAAASVLSVLAEFVVNLNASVKKNEERKEAEQRKAAAEKKKRESDAVRVKKQGDNPTVEAIGVSSVVALSDRKNTDSEASTEDVRDALNGLLLQRSLFR